MQPSSDSQASDQSQTPSAGPIDHELLKWLSPDRFSDWPSAKSHLLAIFESGVPRDLLVMLSDRLQHHFKDLDDLDSTVSNLARFIAASRSPTSLLALFERDEASLPALLQVFATSQTLANRLIADPESFDLMRASDGQPAERRFLVDELVSELEKIDSPNRAALAIRKFTGREIIRIAYGEFVRELSPDHVGQQLAFIADAVINAALEFVLRRLDEQPLGTPTRVDGQKVRFTVLGLGPLGGKEMGYGFPLQLLFLFDAIEQKNQSHRDFVEQVASNVIELVSSDETAALHLSVNTSFRPWGDQAQICSVDLAAESLESDGRTWHRVALTKARVVAGCQDLGNEFLARMQPWIYRKMLSRRDFADIRTLRRKLQRRFESGQTDGEDVSLAPGGRNDIELMMQFLQLLHGGDSRSVRVGNTAEAITQLERAGCLTHQEASLLGKGYARLCRLQHQISIMFAGQSSSLPHDDRLRRRLAWQLGIRDESGQGGDLERFQNQLQETFELNRKVLNHLMVETPNAESDEAFTIETELVLDPSPEPELVDQTLSRHGLRDPELAMENITMLANESVRFLSRRRCRHFFAAIAPDLLVEISKTPDPDQTLATLARVTDSIGGKSSLWELLGNNPATMQLMVRLCASTPYLSNILVAMPGMIDELIDSLLMDRLPPAERLDARSIDLCRRAADIDIVLHGFKSSAHLMIGVRDMLGKEQVETTHRSLSDTAEACIRRIAEYEQEQLAQRFGDPVNNEGEPAELLAVALGKFGGQEPNYHSDLDVVFLYSGDGETVRRVGGPRKTVTNAQFFNQLTAAIIARVNRPSPYGRLYELDGRLRPTGEEGLIAVSLEQFLNRFQRGMAPLWQRLALCKARVISGSRRLRQTTSDSLAATLCMTKWHGAMLREIRDLRLKSQETANEDNLKRGPGGTVDIELIAQTLTLKHISESPDILATGTIDSLRKLGDAGHLREEDAAKLIHNYRTLRSVEAGLRLMNTPARHELPEDQSKLNELAFLMGEQDAQMIQAMVQQARSSNRRIFDSIFQPDQG